MIATIPLPPYYAVISTNILTDIAEGYDSMAKEMEELGARRSY